MPYQNWSKKIRKDDKDSTKKLMKIAYYVATSNRPFTDFPKIIELVQTFGINLGSTNHSRMSCVRMVDIIAQKMHKKLLSVFLKSKQKFSFIVDESDNISKKCCLIIYLTTVIQDKSTTIFVTVVEVKNYDVDSICHLILSSLKALGISEQVIKERIILFVSVHFCGL